MRNYRIILLFLLILLFTIQQGSTRAYLKKSNPEVFGIPMGAEKDEIHKIFSEARIPLKLSTDSVDVYSQSVIKLNYLKEVWLYYMNGRLAKILFKFSPPIDPYNQTADFILGFYKKLRTFLVKNYGEPTNSMNYIHPNFYYKLVALETGNAYLFDFWENAEGMRVLLYLKGKDMEINFCLACEYIPLFETEK